MRTMLALVAAALMLPAAARADALSFAIPPGSKWTHAYITEAHGTKLHADILRPANLPASAKTQVIISIGPYFNHSGQTGPAGPVEGTPYTPVGEAGPSARFFDYINGAKLLPQGRHRAGHVSGERGRDQLRHVARGGLLAAGRLHVRRHHAQPRCLRRRRAEQRHGRGRRAQRPGRLDDLAALDRGRAPRRRAEGQRRRGSAPGDANLVVDVYDIDSGRNATLISRGAYLLAGTSSRASTSTATTGGSPPATASGCWSPARTPSGGSTCRRAARSPCATRGWSCRSCGARARTRSRAARR
jgi:hypothetical protein